MGTSPVIAYVWAIAICLVCILVAAIIANMIPNTPGGKDITKRKVWFWIIFVLAVVLTFVVNLIIAGGIKVPSKHDDYMLASAIATGIGAVLYILIGLCLSKGMKRSKLGSWF